jgi:hypothetical protein
METIDKATQVILEVPDYSFTERDFWAVQLCHLDEDKVLLFFLPVMLVMLSLLWSSSLVTYFMLPPGALVPVTVLMAGGFVLLCVLAIRARVRQYIARKCPCQFQVTRKGFYTRFADDEEQFKLLETVKYVKKKWGYIFVVFGSLGGISIPQHHFPSTEAFDAFYENLKSLHVRSKKVRII